MFRSKSTKQTGGRASEYASCKDFQRIFSEDMVGLHRLAFLLTADESKAEQCFVAGLEESIHGNPVFRQWARAWSKRAIIQNAVKIMAPASGEQAASPVVPANAEESPLIATVLQWSAFERFVFV